MDKRFTVLFLAQEKNEKNMHLKRIAKNLFSSFVLTKKKLKIKKASSTFLSVRKVAKEACTLKRIAKILFGSAKINKLASLKQNLSFNAALHKILIRNSFNVQRQWNLFEVVLLGKFLNSILLMCVTGVVD